MLAGLGFRWGGFELRPGDVDRFRRILVKEVPEATSLDDEQLETIIYELLYFAAVVRLASSRRTGKRWTA